MRLELQFSSGFVADYLAGKIIGLIADKLEVGTTLQIGSIVNYVPRASPTIINRPSGVVDVGVALSPILPVLQLELSASTTDGLAVTATLVNRDDIVNVLSSLSSSFDQNWIPISLSLPIDLAPIVGSSLSAPTMAGFAASAAAGVVALRVEFGAAASADSSSWTTFLDGHAFTPALQPSNITVDPPHEWAALLDWQIVKPAVAAQLEPLVNGFLPDLASDAAVTGAFEYAWGLSFDDHVSGFAGGWPFDSKGAFDLDVTCPVHAQGHDGDLYFQIVFSARARNLLRLRAEHIGAQVWCNWLDLDSYEVNGQPLSSMVIDYPFGGFDFDGNFLEVDTISTDVRGVVARGEAVLNMPLAFPTPSVTVGNFTWILEDSCNIGALAQTVVVSLTNATGGWTTPLYGQLTVDTSVQFKVESIPAVNAHGIGTAPLAWTVTVADQDVPMGGGQVTVSVQTNAGAPPFRSGPSATLPLFPPLTDAEKEQMVLGAVATCASSKRLGYVKKFVPDPPEEIIWWRTQELVLVPQTTLAGQPMAVAGPVTQVAVPKSGLAAAIREQKKNPHGVVQQHSIGEEGVRVVVRRVELPARAKTRIIREQASATRGGSGKSQRRST